MASCHDFCKRSVLTNITDARKVLWVLETCTAWNSFVFLAKAIAKGVASSLCVSHVAKNDVYSLFPCLFGFVMAKPVRSGSDVQHNRA